MSGPRQPISDCSGQNWHAAATLGLRVECPPSALPMSAKGQVPTSRATIESVCFVPFSRHSPRTDSAPFVAKRGHQAASR